MAVSRKRIFVTLCTVAVVLLGGAVTTALLIGHRTAAPRVTTTSDTPSSGTSSEVKKGAYEGKWITIDDIFSVKVPNGWSASVSDGNGFTAIMFARPEHLNSLTYDPSSAPTIDHDGIPAWNGLTEHFFIITPTAPQQFKPSDHKEISTTSFTFDDGTDGKKYYVVKHAEEAKKWGGLLRDAEWQGRTYIYEKGGKRIEAHLALYPSSTTDINFYESVVKSVVTK